MADRKLSLEECVKGFLELVIRHPEKAPRTQRDQRENEMMIIGFNRAQETLRGILELNGKPNVAILAETRSDGQRKPMDVGGIRAWVIG